MKNESDSPETDMVASPLTEWRKLPAGSTLLLVDADFARKLEQQRDALKREVATLKSDLLFCESALEVVIKQRDVESASLAQAQRERDEAKDKAAGYFMAYAETRDIVAEELKLPLTPKEPEEVRAVLRAASQEVEGLRSALSISEARVKELEAEANRLRSANETIAGLEASIADFVNTEARECGAVESPNYQAGNIKDCVARIVDRLRQQLAQAKNELEQARLLTDLKQVRVEEVEEENDRISAQLATLTASATSNASDKERLDWLEGERSDVYQGKPQHGGCLENVLIPHGSTLRQAIDAARLAAKGTEGKP